ncbi:MAG: thiamine-phosphate kinase [Pseudomonadota bacterium]
MGRTLSEEDVIRLVQSMTGGGPVSGLTVGIGDDAAVIQHPGGRLVVTTDLLVEGVHFDLSYTSPYDLGWRAMAANLSDVGAMGALPRWGFLSLGLAGPPDEDFVAALLRGMLDLARPHGLEMAGGDTVSAPQAVINLCLIGAAAGVSPLLRSGARPGQAVCVTGSLGAAAAGLAWLQAGRDKADPAAAAAVTAHLRPEPRVAAGRALATSGRVGAMMDLSDGLASDLARLCAASGVGAVVEEAALPISPATRALAGQVGGDPLDWAIAGGEDFELLFTCEPGEVNLLAELVADVNPGLALTRVGSVGKGRGVRLKLADGNTREITLCGYDHFRTKPGG